MSGIIITPFIKYFAKDYKQLDVNFYLNLIDKLNRLFEEAKTNIEFSIDNNHIIAEVEKLLKPYNISFGNRIAMQIENFVRIYAACFEVNEETINEALEIILLSKVVRKLELKNIEDKDELAQEFANLNLNKCSEFILNLKED